MAVVHITRDLDQRQWIKFSNPLQQETVRAAKATSRHRNASLAKGKKDVFVAKGYLLVY